MKSSKKLYKKKMQPPKYAIGAVLAPLAAAAATSGVPAAGAAATGAAATGAAATGAAATSAAATGATTAGALSASTSGTIAGATGTSSGASASTGVPFGMLKSNANPNTMQGFNSMLGIDPTKAAGGAPKVAGGTPNLGSSKDAGWSGTNIEDLATGKNVNAANITNAGNVKDGQLTQSKNASNQAKDIMQLDSINDILSLSTGKLPMLAIFGIRENALERQKGKMNQMNFANNMNSNMDSGAYGDLGFMKKGGIMKSVAELTGQEYIVPKELIPYALAAGNAKPYASDKTDGAYSHETNPIQVYRAGGDMYVDEQGNTMQAGDLIIPEHKANSRAGIMSAINQNPYNNRASLGNIIDPDKIAGASATTGIPIYYPQPIRSSSTAPPPSVTSPPAPSTGAEFVSDYSPSSTIYPTRPIIQIQPLPTKNHFSKYITTNQIEPKQPTQLTRGEFDKMLGYKDQQKDDKKGLNKYHAMAGMAAYTLGANSLNRLKPAEQVRNAELVNPREAQFNPYFMLRQAKDMANQYYNTSQYTKSGSLSDNIATATNAQQMANEIMTKTGATIAEAQQAEDFKNAELYNAALTQNAESVNRINMYNADLLQKSNAMKTEANYRNMQELNKSIIGIQELDNMSKSQSIQEDVIKYQLDLQKQQADDDLAFKNWQAEYQRWLDAGGKGTAPAIPIKKDAYPIFNFRRR